MNDTFEKSRFKESALWKRKVLKIVKAYNNPPQLAATVDICFISLSNFCGIVLSLYCFWCSPLIFSGEEPLVISAAKPKFSSPIWIEEIQRNKIFNKQKSVCNDDAGDNELPLPLTNGAIFLTEPPRTNGDANAGGSGDVTPRRTRVRFPVRSISEILEFEDDEEPAGAPTPANGGGGICVSKSAAVANSAGENGNGGVNRRFLQTDIWSDTVVERDIKTQKAMEFFVWDHRVHRVATAAFWRTFSHEGKISPGLVRVGGARPPPFIITSKVAVYAPAEWAETLTLFHL